MSLRICLGTTLPGNDQNSGKGRNMAALPSLLVSGRTLPSHRGNKGRQREIAKNGQKDSFVFYTVQMPKQYLFMKSAVTQNTTFDGRYTWGVCGK